MAQSHGCEFSNVETKHACQFALPMAFSQRPAVHSLGETAATEGTAAKAAISVWTVCRLRCCAAYV
jgi:hypothetical protein